MCAVIYLYLSALWWTGHLSRVYPSSCLISSGKDSRKENKRADIPKYWTTYVKLRCSLYLTSPSPPSISLHLSRFLDACHPPLMYLVSGFTDLYSNSPTTDERWYGCDWWSVFTSNAMKMGGYCQNHFGGLTCYYQTPGKVNNLEKR